MAGFQRKPKSQCVGLQLLRLFQDYLAFTLSITQRVIEAANLARPLTTFVTREKISLASASAVPLQPPARLSPYHSGHHHFLENPN